jgi:positive regulator of sigma E activity
MDAAEIGYVLIMTADVLDMVGATVVVLVVLMVLAGAAGFLLARLERRRARRIHDDLVRMRDERRRQRG